MQFILGYFEKYKKFEKDVKNLWLFTEIKERNVYENFSNKLLTLRKLN